MIALARVPEMVRAAARVAKPPEDLLPSEWAERYRFLAPGTTSRPGRWSGDVFPFLRSVMDSCAEAIRLGKRGVVLMKAGQIGGSEAMINVAAWLKTTIPGPSLYLISKDEIAREFGRERFGPLIDTCKPLRERALRGRKSGELVHTKRFVDGKWVIVGGRSILNLESQPYRVVVIDEYDSMQDELAGRGDPLANAEIRTDAFTGSTLIIAFAHPTTRERGAGRLYYERSDQRRAFAACAHCSSQIWLSWDQVKVIPEAGETLEAAERIAARYHLVAPCCGAEITDAERYAMAARTEQRSTLPQEEAARRPWIGLHISQLYTYKPLSTFAQHWVEALEDDGRRRVFVNKRLGDVYSAEEKATDLAAWRACVVVPRSEDDPEAYRLGTVPPGVRFLTAGQDSRLNELHWAVWGWGLLRTADEWAVLCGWLVDCGVEPGPRVVDPGRTTLDASDLRVFDQLLYERRWPTARGDQFFRVDMGLHDSGWQPIAVYDYCLSRPRRAYPSKGMSEDDRSQAPTFRFTPIEWGPPGRPIRYQRADLNTFRLKEDFFGLVERRFVLEGERAPRPRIVLPVDVPEPFLAQSSSEYLANERGKRVWRHRGANHWADCDVLAYAAAERLNPLQGDQTAAEVAALEDQRPRRVVTPPAAQREPRMRLGVDRTRGWIARR